MSVVRQAVILAAGTGSRLRDVLKDRPKGFIEIGGKPIIEQSIANLAKGWINEIIIVTGHKSEYYEHLKERYPFVKTIRNEWYETTGSMSSLSVAAPLLHEDFLLLESDLIYERRALLCLQNVGQKNCILLSGRTGAGDEVFAETKGGRVVRLSKHPSSTGLIGGEFVGISRISSVLYRKMFRAAKKWTDDAYEGCLTDLASAEEIGFELVGDLAWAEIDSSAHLERARKVFPDIERADATLDVRRRVERKILLNPGPATTSDSVKHALVVEDICPREEEFGRLVEGIRRDLLRVVHGQVDYEAILFASAGTGAVEACLTSVIRKQKVVVIINNGAYGERMQQICEAFGIRHLDYNIEWGKPIDLNVLETILRDNANEVSHVAFVHHETTVGLLNPLADIVRVASDAGIEVIVDAMSSFAGIPINLRVAPVHYLISSANKCLQGMAGVSFVVARRDALLSTQTNGRRNFYFNLYANYLFFSRNGQTQFTPPVQVLYALRQALNEYFLEGEKSRWDRYNESYEVLANGLKDLGFEFFVDKKHHARLLTAVLEPEDRNYTFQDMHDYLLKKGFTIYPGKTGERRMFRIAVMGEITKEDIRDFLRCLSVYLKERKITMPRTSLFAVPVPEEET